MPEIDTILFDISGVLVELGGMPDFVRWSGKSPDEVISCWLQSSSVQEFESGNIEFGEFHALFCDEWGITISETKLKMSFESWVKRVIPGSFELLNKLNENYSLACLTNTNSIQWPIIQNTLNPDLYFDNQFVSFLMGCVKPNEEIYTKVIGELNVPAEKILFFDDSSLNVTSARQLGMNAHFAKGVSSVQDILSKLEII